MSPRRGGYGVENTPRPFDLSIDSSTAVTFGYGTNTYASTSGASLPLNFWFSFTFSNWRGAIRSYKSGLCGGGPFHFGFTSIVSTL